MNKFDATTEEVREDRDNYNLSMQGAKHKVVKAKLEKVLRYSCTQDDLRQALLKIVTDGGLRFG